MARTRKTNPIRREPSESGTSTQTQIPTSSIRSTTNSHPLLPELPRVNADFGVEHPRDSLYQNLFNSRFNPPAAGYPSDEHATHPITFEENAIINDFDRILKELDEKVVDLETNFELAAKKVQLAVLRGIIRRRHIARIPVPQSILNPTREIA